jgi:L-lactate dehydrogenase complex protein LldG
VVAREDLVRAREEILERIRIALGDEGGLAPMPSVPRSYRTDSPCRYELTARFADRVSDYRATVHRVFSASELVETVATICLDRGAQRLGVASGVPWKWRPSTGVTTVPVSDLCVAGAHKLDAALTGCALAMAETGTSALAARPPSGG